MQGNWFEKRNELWREFTLEFESWKNDSFSGFCLKECSKHCCDLSDTKLLADKHEFKCLLGSEPSDWKLYETEEEDMYRYQQGDCPQYDREKRLCKIWRQARPSICAEFPFGLYHDVHKDEKKVHISPACGFCENSVAYTKLKELIALYNVEVVWLKAGEE